MMVACQAVRNPRTGEFDYQLELTDKSAIVQCVAEMREAQSHWRELSIEQRCAILKQLGQQIAEQRSTLRDALFADTGRSKESEMEIDGVINAIGRWCDLAPPLLVDAPPRESRIRGLTYAAEQVPYALVGVISPWNLPLLLALIDAIPALLCGCAVLIKPSEYTPRFIEPLRRCIAAVPELAGVIRLLGGDGSTGAELINHVDVVVFTGSVGTGEKVALAAARRLIPVFLELGGKDPAIVLDDADIDHAVTAIAWGALSNSGQACQSIERIYVQRSIFEIFVERLVARVQQYKLNCDSPEASGLGPVITSAQVDILQSQLDDARARGADILCGGHIRQVNQGFWCEPTVLCGVNHQMKVMREESFGPLLPVMPFDTVEEAIALANDSPYGLSAAVFAASSEQATAIGRQLEVGAVSINDCSLTAFIHEVEKQSFKASGLGGSRMGAASILRFLRKKAYFVNERRQIHSWWDCNN